MNKQILPVTIEKELTEIIELARITPYTSPQSLAISARLTKLRRSYPIDKKTVLMIGLMMRPNSRRARAQLDTIVLRGLNEYREPNANKVVAAQNAWANRRLSEKK